jgi:myo-inositol-1(or 4)-monophosphatase
MDTALRHRVNAARVAVESQIPFFQRQLGAVTPEWKVDETRVTFADFAISEHIIAELNRSFPEDKVLSEEGAPADEVFQYDSKYVWILDPIDGTNNYVLGMSACAISLALCKDGQPVYGIIYDNARGVLLEGGPNKRLLVGGRRFKPPQQDFSKRSGMIALHFPLRPNRAQELAPVLEKYRVRSLGSAALQLAYVALGRLDGAFDEKVRIWDIAAALCLLEAAGVGVRFLDGSPFPLQTTAMAGPHLRILAGNPGFLEVMENCLG